MYVQVFLPGTVTPTDIYAVFSTGSSSMINLTNLPASGTYTALVSIVSGTPFVAQLTVVPQ